LEDFKIGRLKDWKIGAMCMKFGKVEKFECWGVGDWLIELLSY